MASEMTRAWRRIDRAHLQEENIDDESLLSFSCGRMGANKLTVELINVVLVVVLICA